MTAEEKNRVIELDNANYKSREIARIIGKDVANISRLLSRVKNENIVSFGECPNCGKEIVHYKVKGRKRVYCCEKCKRSNKVRRNTKYTCLNCGRTFYSYHHQKSKFCSVSCYLEHRYGKRLQKENS